MSEEVAEETASNEAILEHISPEKLAEIQERLAALPAPSDGQTISGSEAVEAPDLSNFDIPANLLHLYERATVVDGQWVAVFHEYMFESGPWRALNQDGTIRLDKKNISVGLEQKVNQVVNGADGMLAKKNGWKLTAILPSGIGNGVAIFERMIKSVLPTPKVIESSTEVEPVSDEELSRMQDKAKEWAGGADQTANPS